VWARNADKVDCYTKTIEKGIYSLKKEKGRYELKSDKVEIEKRGIASVAETDSGIDLSDIEPYLDNPEYGL